MTFTIELEREADGRWIAEVPGLPGALCYGQDRDAAVAGVQALALRNGIVEPLGRGGAAEMWNAARLPTSSTPLTVSIRDSR